MSERRANKWVNKFAHTPCMYQCYGPCQHLSPSRIWTSSRGLFTDVHVCSSKHTLTIAHWMTCHDLSWLKPGAPIHHHQIQLPAPTMSLLSGEEVTPFSNNYSVKNLDSPLPPTAPEPPHLVGNPGLVVIFFKVSPVLSLPLQASVMIPSLALTLHRCAPLCVDLCSCDPTWEWLPLPSYSSFYHHT